MYLKIEIKALRCMKRDYGGLRGWNTMPFFTKDSEISQLVRGFSNLEELAHNLGLYIFTLY